MTIICYYLASYRTNPQLTPLSAQVLSLRRVVERRVSALEDHYR